MVHHFTKTMTVLDDTALNSAEFGRSGAVGMGFEACNLGKGKGLLTFHPARFFIIGRIL